MPNTNVLTHLKGPGAGKDGIHVMHFHCISDGSEETALVVFDNSDAGYGPSNVAKGSIVKVKLHGKCSGIVRLAWDQATDFKALTVGGGGYDELCLEDIGGVQNPNGTGATGDILLTTTGLVADDEFVLLIYVKV